MLHIISSSEYEENTGNHVWKLAESVASFYSIRKERPSGHYP